MPLRNAQYAVYELESEKNTKPESRTAGAGVASRLSRLGVGESERPTSGFAAQTVEKRRG